MTPRRFLARLNADPYLIALIGTVALAAILPARGAAVGVVDIGVYAAVSTLFFLYGARLAPQAVIAGMIHWRLQLLVLASTYLLFPAIGFVMTAILQRWLAPNLSLGLMFVSVLPSTVQSSIAFTSIARGNVSAALCSASVSNLIGVLLTPALVAVFLNAHGSGFDVKAIENIALQILAPFVAGQLCRPLIGPWLQRRRRVTSLVDRGSILLVVYAAFGAGMVAGIWSKISAANLALVFATDSILLAVVLVATTCASRWMGFSTEDEIAIVFCGSKKSMAAGIPMANILFPGDAVSLIVLPLMLFHQTQLFVCAILARRYASRGADPEAHFDAGASGATGAAPAL